MINYVCMYGRTFSEFVVKVRKADDLLNEKSEIYAILGSILNCISKMLALARKLCGRLIAKAWLCNPRFIHYMYTLDK